MTDLKAGQLDRLITIEQPITTTSDYGDRLRVTGWAVVAKVWASRKDVLGREIVQGGAERAEFATMFKIRDPGVSIDPRMRVCEGDQVFAIDSIASLGRGIGFEIRCRNADGVGAQP